MPEPTVKEQESLIGKLQHATKVVRPGRMFLRQMFELKSSAKRGQKFIRLNANFKLPSLVAPFYGAMEWSVDDEGSRWAGSTAAHLFRCVVIIWLWGLVGNQVISDTVGTGDGREVNSP